MASSCQRQREDVEERKPSTQCPPAAAAGGGEEAPECQNTLSCSAESGWARVWRQVLGPQNVGGVQEGTGTSWLAAGKQIHRKRGKQPGLANKITPYPCVYPPKRALFEILHPERTLFGGILQFLSLWTRKGAWCQQPWGRSIEVQSPPTSRGRSLGAAKALAQTPSSKHCRKRGILVPPSSTSCPLPEQRRVCCFHSACGLLTARLIDCRAPCN